MNSRANFFVTLSGREWAAGRKKTIGGEGGGLLSCNSCCNIAPTQALLRSFNGFVIFRSLALCVESTHLGIQKRFFEKGSRGVLRSRSWCFWCKTVWRSKYENIHEQEGTRCMKLFVTRRMKVFVTCCNSMSEIVCSSMMKIFATFCNPMNEIVCTLCNSTNEITWNSKRLLPRKSKVRSSEIEQKFDLFTPEKLVASWLEAQVFSI
jgi:hypothetical protein